LENDTKTAQDMQVTLFKGIYSINKDGHPVVTTDTGNVWLVSHDHSQEVIENTPIKEGDEVEVWTPNSSLDGMLKGGKYCSIMCPNCKFYGH
jgi:hypothetical protein